MAQWLLGDNLPADEWQRRRRSQVDNPREDGFGPGPAVLADDLPMPEWQRTRALQAQGGDVRFARSGTDSLAGAAETHPPTNAAASAPRRRRLPERAAGTIDTYVPYAPITLNDIVVAGAKAHEFGGEKVREQMPDLQEQRWIGHGLFTDYQGKIPSGVSAPVAGPYDAIIHNHPSNWAKPQPGPGDYGHKVPVYGIVGSRAWIVPPGSDKFYWLK